jgi:hypothetical protein
MYRVHTCSIETVANVEKKRKKKKKEREKKKKKQGKLKPPLPNFAYASLSPGAGRDSPLRDDDIGFLSVSHGRKKHRMCRM